MCACHGQRRECRVCRQHPEEIIDRSSSLELTKVVLEEEAEVTLLHNFRDVEGYYLIYYRTPGPSCGILGASHAA